MQHSSLEERKQHYHDCMSQYKAKIVICGGTGCIANGAMDIFHRFEAVIAAKGLKATVALQKEQADYILFKSGFRDFPNGPLGHAVSARHILCACQSGRWRRNC
jgi:NADH-quinone oxidoreductase subunit F